MKSSKMVKLGINVFFMLILCSMMFGCSPFYPGAYNRPIPPTDAGQVALEILKQVPIMMAVKGVMETSNGKKDAAPQVIIDRALKVPSTLPKCMVEEVEKSKEPYAGSFNWEI